MKMIRYKNATITKFDNTKIVAIANDNFVKLQFKTLQIEIKRHADNSRTNTDTNNNQ